MDIYGLIKEWLVKAVHLHSWVFFMFMLCKMHNLAEIPVPLKKEMYDMSHMGTMVHNALSLKVELKWADVSFKVNNKRTFKN